jgi:CRISPR/Cas system CSM-associated protein Csm3 (group 7 of RAMP superfamily)
MKQEWAGIKIEVTTKEPLHIGGTSHILSDVHNPIVLLNGDTPAIPSTSLKGAWRAQMERFLIESLANKSLLEKGEEKGLTPCIPSQKLTEDEETLFGKYRIKKFPTKDGKTRFSSDPCDYDSKSKYICPVCYLLGAQTLHGFVRVPFLLPAEGQQEIDTLLYSIREDRAKGGAAKGSNRGWYVINPEIKFEGKLEILIKDELNGWEFGKKRAKLKYNWVDKWLDDPSWTAATIKKVLIKERLEAIQLLGGYKYKGCGKVEIKVSLEMS